MQTIKVLNETLSVRGAAALLGVNPSTVTRKLEQLESDLGVVLFTRSAQGLHPTQEMRSIAEQVSLVGEQIADIRSHLQSFNQELHGRIRFALPDAVALEFLLAELTEFSERYPQIDLEIVPGYQQLDLVGGEVDVAIRATDQPPENLVGRPLERAGLAAYAQREFAQRLGLHELAADSVCDLAELPWVDWAAQGEVMDMYRRLQQSYYPGAHVHMRCDHVHMQSVLLQGGMGIGILPCFVGDPQPTLQRLPNMPVQAGPMLWLLSHPDLRAARRVHVFLEYITEVVRRHSAELIGEDRETGETGKNGKSGKNGKTGEVGEQH